MSARARLLFLTLAAFLAACGEDEREPTGPATPPTRAELNGLYACAWADVFYAGTGGVDASERWRTGSCAQYIALTSPNRAYEIDTTQFVISEDDRIWRLREFPTGEITYDATTGTVQATYRSGETASYVATTERLLQRFPAADYTGDGRPDSVALSFVRVGSPPR